MEPRVAKKKTPRGSKEAEVNHVLVSAIINSIDGLKQCVNQLDERLLVLEERARQDEAANCAMRARHLGGSPIH